MTPAERLTAFGLGMAPRRQRFPFGPADGIIAAMVMAILVGVGAPQAMRFIREAQTTEPATRMPSIVRTIQAFVDANPQWGTAELNAMLGYGERPLDVTCRPKGTGADCLAVMIPVAALVPETSRWRYRIVARVAPDRTVHACLLARRYSPFGGDAPQSGGVLYSSVTEYGRADEGWHHAVHIGNHIEASEVWTGIPYGACAAPSDPPVLRLVG